MNLELLEKTLHAEPVPKPEEDPGKNINKHFRIKIDNIYYTFQLIKTFPKGMIPPDILHRIGTDYITHESPLGAAIKNADPGAETNYKAPEGIIKVKILQIYG